jgi:tryptophan halogenase
MTVPDSLREKVALFRAKGRVFRDHLELFGTTSWVAVALGQHVVPEEPEPAVHGLDPDKVRIALEQMRKTYLEVAQHLPSHGDFLRQCGRPDPAPSAETASAAPATPFFSFEAESPIPLDKGLPI